MSEGLDHHSSWVSPSNTTACRSHFVSGTSLKIITETFPFSFHPLRPFPSTRSQFIDSFHVLSFFTSFFSSILDFVLIIFTLNYLSPYIFLPLVSRSSSIILHFAFHFFPPSSSYLQHSFLFSFPPLSSVRWTAHFPAASTSAARCWSIL